MSNSPYPSTRWMYGAPMNWNPSIHGEVSAVPRDGGGLTVTVTLPRDAGAQSPNRLGSVASSLK